jgi:hypothetical protein
MLVQVNHQALQAALNQACLQTRMSVTVELQAQSSLVKRTAWSQRKRVHPKQSRATPLHSNGC